MTFEDCQRSLMIELFRRGAVIAAQVSVFLNETGDCAIAEIYPRFGSDESFSGEFVVQDRAAFDGNEIAAFLGESLSGEFLTVH